MENQIQYTNSLIKTQLENMEFYKRINCINNDNFFERETFADEFYYNLGVIIEDFIKENNEINFIENIDLDIKNNIINSYIEEWDNDNDLNNQLIYFYIHANFIAFLENTELERYIGKDIIDNQNILKKRG